MSENEKVSGKKKLPPMKINEQGYYPSPVDNMWNQEVSALIPWLEGKGVDIGCGTRSIFKTDVRVDADERVKPDVLNAGDDLPFEDGQFDYLYGIHALEHFADGRKTLVEWARVVKKGGVVAIVHPDVEFTGIQIKQGENLDPNPFNEHYKEMTRAQFLEWFKAQRIPNLEFVAAGVATGNWSFYVIFMKK